MPYGSPTDSPAVSPAEAASVRHREIYGRYEKLYNLIDFLAAIGFLLGSILFFYPSQETAAIWLFVVGSILFAARPTVRVLREFHLARLPLPGDHPPVATSRTT